MFKILHELSISIKQLKQPPILLLCSTASTSSGSRGSSGPFQPCPFHDYDLVLTFLDMGKMVPDIAFSSVNLVTTIPPWNLRGHMKRTQEVATRFAVKAPL